MVRFTIPAELCYHVVNKLQMFWYTGVKGQNFLLLCCFIVSMYRRRQQNVSDRFHIAVWISRVEYKAGDTVSRHVSSCDVNACGWDVRGVLTLSSMAQIHTSVTLLTSRDLT
jgi:hypothetical protein